MIIANPIYDSVFKLMMADFEVASGVISALIGMQVLELKIEPQEFVRKDSATGNLNGIRLDFHALVETEERGPFNVIIELQKASVGTNALRFRHYLGNQYQSVVESRQGKPESLPIISIYLLGYNIDQSLPMVVHVDRSYRNAVTKELVSLDMPRHEFIELLTHDAYFVQIPRIDGSLATELERVLSVFDQQRKLENDRHRLEVDINPVHSYPLLKRIYRILNKVQEDPEIERAMNLEDLFILEQQDAAQAERKLRLEAEVQREEAEVRCNEERRKREAAEQELKALKKSLGENDKDQPEES